MDGLEEELDALERILCGQKDPDSLDFRLLRRLTGNFSDDRRIGEGGCGEVYKGLLPNGEVIAVKKLKKYHIIDEKMFLREVDSMIKVRHENIVRFLGYCSEIKEKAVLMDGKIVMAEEREKLLCFPYMSNGSLDKYLTDELRGFEWHTRYQIIKGICDGLLHLHKEKGIMHMDLKPANILLGDKMVPKITDFGVSRIDGKTQITSAERLFSRGHAAPEYIDTGVRSWKSDIYSLGVIMMELVTGSRKIPNTTKVLRRWRHRWNKSSKHTPLSYLQVKKCLKLAVSCQEKNPVNRPFIWDVVCELDKLDSWDGRIRESSIEKIISSPDDMLGTEPLELHFTLAHDMKQISCSVELTNNTDDYMAFRTASTSLLPFSIQPAKGIAAPRSQSTTSITLSAQEMTPLLHNLGEEGFIVQSTRIDGTFTALDITDDTFNDEGANSQEKNGDGDKVVDEVNLTVLFDEMLHEEDRKDVANLSAEMGSLGTSSQEGLKQSILEGAYSNQQNHTLRGAGARGPYDYSQSQEYHAESSTAAATASRNSSTDQQIAWDFEYAMQLQQLMEDLSVEDDDDISCVPFPSDSVDEQESDEEEEADRKDGNGDDDDDPDNMTYEQRQALVEAVGAECRGLSDELISYLEPWKYIAVKASGVFYHEDCPICLSTFRSRETMITLLCRHHYHADCVTKWLKVNKTCPVCKYELFGPS